MVRRYYRRTPRSNNRDKYSVEQTLISAPAYNAWTEVPATDSTKLTRQFSISVIPPTSEQGMRKVKHFTLSFSNANMNGAPLVYALVYVPEGYDPNPINVPIDGNAISMYEPNQFVISQGIIDTDAGPQRIRSPLSRNLNSGDSIYLIIAATSSAGTPIISVKYAITLQ